MLGKKKTTRAQQVASMLGGVLGGRAAGPMKVVGTALGTIALTTVGASAVINSVRKKD